MRSEGPPPSPPGPWRPGASNVRGSMGGDRMMRPTFVIGSIAAFGWVVRRGCVDHGQTPPRVFFRSIHMMWISPVTMGGIHDQGWGSSVGQMVHLYIGTSWTPPRRSDLRPPGWVNGGWVGMSGQVIGWKWYAMPCGPRAGRATADGPPPIPSLGRSPW